MRVTEAELQLATKAAAAAEAVLRSCSHQINAQAGRDIKAQADLDAEAAILEILRTSDLPVLSEEQGADARFTLEEDGWIIDPLDGTMNFIRGIPVACTCIALWRAGRPALGVIHEHGRHAHWVGGASIPTTCNGRPCAIGSAGTPAEAVLATGFPRGLDFSAAAMANYTARMSAFKKVRMIGCAGLSLAWTAGGHMDLYLEDGIYLWDVAAGLALVEGAGGSSHLTSVGPHWQTDVVAGVPALVDHARAGGVGT